MIAQIEPIAQSRFSRATPSIAADALTRIPVAHFRDIAWAKDSIATCTAMLAHAVDGDRSAVGQWMQEAAAGRDAQPFVSVLCAVCDAIVADTFRSRGDVVAVSAFIASVEREALGRLAADRETAARCADDHSELAEFAAGLIRVVQMHDADTAIHLEATAVLARRIALALHLPRARVATIELAASLHDIGKLSVPAELLRKPGRLSAGEWSEMRRHAEFGAAALLDIPKLAHLAPIVRSHHERIDGLGYPDRLRAAEIPLEARVIAVANAFHAMTAEQSYRHAIMPNDALAILAENAGTQFDVDVVTATFDVFRVARRPRRKIA